MIKEIVKLKKTMEVVIGSDVKYEVTKLNKRENWKKVLMDEKFTVLKYDIKEQFTNLDCNEVMQAFTAMIDTYGKDCRFVLAKNRCFKREDRIITGEKTADNQKNWIIGSEVVSLICGLPALLSCVAVLPSSQDLW